MDWYPLTDPDFMLSVLTCGSWNVWNDTGYCTKTYDGLYQAQSAATSPAKRQQIVYQMQQMVASAKPYLVLDFPDAIEAHSTAWADLPLIAGISWNSMSKIPGRPASSCRSSTARPGRAPRAARPSPSPSRPRPGG